MFFFWIFFGFLFNVINGNELSRCCGGGSRHYKEMRTCLGLKASGQSATCGRAASICCLRASLEKSCELGTEMGQSQGYCSATVNILGGGLRKECCDCCLLGKELAETEGHCDAPKGFSAYCLKSFNQCCSGKFSSQPPEMDSALGVTFPDELLPTGRCSPKVCDHFCTDRGENGIECSCRPGYDLGPDGKSCIEIPQRQRIRKPTAKYPIIPPASASVKASVSKPNPPLSTSAIPSIKNACQSGEHRCRIDAEFCVPLENGHYRCELRPARMIKKIADRTFINQRRECPSGYRWIREQCEDVNECEELGTPILCAEPNTQCLNTVGSYQCVCQMGFYWSDAGAVCVDIDECLLLVDDCLESQRCLNTPGSYKCIRTLSCGTGYALNSETEECVDVDECNLGSHDCGPLYHCRNTQGSYRCDPKTCGPAEVMDTSTGECASVSCPIGYAAKNGKCEDVDECATAHPCSLYEECINTPGSFRCQEKGTLCAPGYFMDGESGFCLDVDECTTGAHTCGSLQCINLPGSFKCRCMSGFEFNETSKLCEDVDECAKFHGHICSHHATCENTIGSFVCHCNPGYKLAEDGRHCDDVDECATGEAKCQQRCINTPGSHQCLCERGFQLGANEMTCEDIDECETWSRTGNQLCMGECLNTVGSFRCTCPPGYELQSDNITCKDIDECINIGCPNEEQICVNTLGSYRCQTVACPKNYVPDKHYKNRCVRRPGYCYNSYSERCKRSPVHISWQHIAIPKHVNISTLRTSITLFSMKGPISDNSSMQFELRLIKSTPEGENVVPAVRENFLIQKGDDRNSAVIALRDSLDGPQEVHLELVLRLSNNGEFAGKYVANLVVYVSTYPPAPLHRHSHHHNHHHFAF